jgi:hypothetical protein
VELYDLSNTIRIKHLFLRVAIARQIATLKGRLTALDRERSEIAERLGVLERAREEAKQPTHAAAGVTMASPTTAKIALFRNLFRGREDVLPRRWGFRKEKPMGIGFLEHIKEVPDHRVAGMVTYPLDEILLATLVGVLCGVDDWEAVELLSREYLGWLKQFLPYKSGVPHAQTFRKVFRLSKPEVLEECFAS